MTMLSSDEEFLSHLPVFRHFEDVAEPELYRPLPDGWALALADIVDSTDADRKSVV